MTVSGPFTIRKARFALPVAFAIFSVFAMTASLSQAAIDQHEATDETSVLQATSPKDRFIAGGRNTKAAKHPGLVQITLNGENACGGALIHPMLVLTSVDCLWNREQGDWWPLIGHMEAFAGRSSVNAGGEELLIQNWTGSRDFNEFTGENDYGILVLHAPASSPTLKIAGPTERALWRAGRKGTVAGFGSTSDGGPASPVLKQLKLPILKDPLCRSGKAYGKHFFSKSMFCAGFMKGVQSPCWGDYGAPLTVPIDGGGHRIVGLTSWGDGCGKRKKPWVFSRIAEPSISRQVNALSAEASQVFKFPGRHSYVNVVGAGGKPLGCAAAKAKKNAAAARWTKAKQALNRLGTGNSLAVKQAAKAKKQFKTAAKARQKTCF